MTLYYVLFVWGGVDPKLYGPFETPDEQERVARELVDPNGGLTALEAERSVFWLDVDDVGVPDVGPFAFRDEGVAPGAGEEVAR